ncbi:hypothetical protein EVAR_56648_1 [Eumeta japonica]|uniref:Uncharacterized protein n=1 Tax=Eumeta variegata TaxID=151549 RepID=A0A4C1YVM2_EUMVA|nr:hypothetical protein EVAR_56648_1 [Eumeta japonica]
MCDVLGPSKRFSTDNSSFSLAKKRRKINQDSSLDESDCSSEEADYSQCNDEDQSDTSEGGYWHCQRIPPGLVPGSPIVVGLSDLNGWVSVQKDGYEKVLGKFRDEKVNENGWRIDELSIKCLLYVDDQVIFAPSPCELQKMVNKMNGSFKKKGCDLASACRLQSCARDGVNDLALSRSSTFRPVAIRFNSQR